MTDRLLIYGAGGHAKVVVEAWRASYPGGEVIVFDDDPAAAGRTVLGAPVAGGRDWLSNHYPGEQVMPALGNNRHRFELIRELKKAGRSLRSVVHPTAVISPSCRIGQGSFIAAGAVINAESTLDEAVIVNTGASVDHDCRLGTAAHLAPGARLCGSVLVGARALIGTCSAVIPGVSVGNDAVVGAGSAVVRDVPHGARWAGCPARPI